jgi:hypothetical protein
LLAAALGAAIFLPKNITTMKTKTKIKTVRTFESPFAKDANIHLWLFLAEIKARNNFNSTNQ